MRTHTTKEGACTTFLRTHGFVCTHLLQVPPSCANLFRPQGRHILSGSFITVMSLAVIIVEHYNPSPIMIGYWLGSACLLPSVFALAREFFGSHKRAMACFFIDVLVLIISIPVLMLIRIVHQQHFKDNCFSFFGIFSFCSLLKVEVMLF